MFVRVLKLLLALSTATSFAIDGEMPMVKELQVLNIPRVVCLSKRGETSKPSEDSARIEGPPTAIQDQPGNVFQSSKISNNRKDPPGEKAPSAIEPAVPYVAKVHQGTTLEAGFDQLSDEIAIYRRFNDAWGRGYINIFIREVFGRNIFG